MPYSISKLEERKNGNKELADQKRIKTFEEKENNKNLKMWEDDIIKQVEIKVKIRKSVP